MTLQNGRQSLALPGPTTIPDEVLSAMHRPAMDIYAGEMIGVTDSCLADLPGIFGTEGRVYIYAANGHGAWEAALTNTLSRGDTVLALESGRFAIMWGETAKMLGVNVEVLAGDDRRAVDPAALEARLREDKAGTIKAVLAVQIDTSTSVLNDIPAIRKAMNAAGHGALLLVDAIASLGTMPFEMDNWGVDVAVTGSQKGLMTPPGLGFVAANAKARDIHETADLRTRYWDWTFREGNLHYQKYCGTPPEHLLFGLRKALDMLLAEGLPGAFERHRILAGATQRAIARWAEAGAIEMNITDPAHRAPSVTTVIVNEPHDAEALLAYCNEKCGVVLGIGIGALDGRAFRIAHMGHVNAPMLLGTLGVVETALKALNIPHGSGGVQAAIDWIAGEVPA